MTERLQLESDWDELTAWIDGQLEPARARRVTDLVATDPAWKAACDELTAVDDLLGALPAPPAPPADLADRIVAAALREGQARRTVKIWWTAAGSLAAAACIALAVWAGVTHLRPGTTPELAGGRVGGVEGIINKELRDVPQDDRPIVANLPLFKNYSEVKAYAPVSTVADAETISALAQLEAK